MGETGTVPSLEHLKDAARRISSHVIRTPLLEDYRLNEILGCRALVKAECLQRTGAFKIRGALNKVFWLAPEVRKKGLIAFSAGNHGLGVAAAARIAGCTAKVLLPTTATETKIESCRWWASEVLFYDPEKDDREVIGRKIAEQHGLTLIQPFDDFQVVAGQGTVGLELCEQAIEQKARLDAVFVNCSGGGLSAGIAIALKTTFPNAVLYIVEPQSLEKMGRSLISGRPERNPVNPKSIMDAIVGPRVGSIPLSVLRQHQVRGVSVSDQEVLAAMSLAFKLLKVVVEPGGAAALAAVQSKKVDLRDKTIGIVCSGGNVDSKLFARVLVEGQIN
jgi:threonine dehydratase